MDTGVAPTRRKLNVGEYDRMAEVGILGEKVTDARRRYRVRGTPRPVVSQLC